MPTYLKPTTTIPQYHTPKSTEAYTTKKKELSSPTKEKKHE
jgi:hypothetical protein